MNNRIPTDEIIELELLLEPGVVSRNVREAEFVYANPYINDNNYPVSGEGIVMVRFMKISGELFKHENNDCYPWDFQRYCRENGLRQPNAAEATLLPAKDKQIGRGEHPLLAFIGGSRDAFIVDERFHDRRLFRSFDIDWWHPCYDCLVVCE